MLLQDQILVKIKQNCNNIEGSFNGKLKFWDITEVERAYRELSSSMEIINKAINVEIDKQILFLFFETKLDKNKI